LHPDRVNTLSARIVSESDPDGIVVVFHESGPNTASFIGAFSTGSTPSVETLHVEAGDSLQVLYQPSGSRAKFVVNGITESGLFQVTDTGLPQGPDEYLVIGGAIRMDLIDAQKSADGKIRITISYSNAPIDESGKIFDNDQSELRMIQEFLPTQWEDITLRDENGTVIGLDPDTRKVTGETNALGVVILGFNTGPPGGCGGGCALPGSGVVLDSSATVEARDESLIPSEKSKSGNGGSRSSTIRTTETGENVERTFNTPSGVVSVNFENIGDGGQLKVSTNRLSSFEQLFDDIGYLDDDNQHGIIWQNGASFATAGEVFDIEASTIQFNGMVFVTIPYEEETANLFGSEANIRFIHYDEQNRVWEDKTHGFDLDPNTVTGVVDSFSPVAAAIILKDDRIGALAPGIQLAPSLEVSSPTASTSGSGDVKFSTQIANLQNQDQDFVAIIQIEDDRGVVHRLDWQQGTLKAGSDSQVLIDSTNLSAGGYTVKFIILDELQNPWLLSPVNEMKFNIDSQ
jgi:hypothetical protein